MDPEARTRAAIEDHWRASEAGAADAEYAIYAEDAILDYPQSGERYRGRTATAAQRGGHPADRHFTEPFAAPAWRAALAEPMPGREINQA